MRGQLNEFDGRFWRRGDAIEVKRATAQCCRAMTPDLVPNSLRNLDEREVGEQVQATKLIEVNERAGITNDQTHRISFGHATPTRRPRV